MPSQNPLQLDAIIIGGGIAGLWTLAELTRRGHRCILLEKTALGTGQTIASQGIIHSGLKYTLAGLMNPSARAIRDMPDLWKRCLAGTFHPDLSSATIRAESCHLWQTRSLRSRAGMIGARAGLRVKPVALTGDHRPGILRTCPGTVARLDEQVIDPESVLNALATPLRNRIFHIPDSALKSIELYPDYVEFTLTLSGEPPQLLRAQRLILTAGSGNAALRAQLGLSSHAQQRRPLHMVMLRGLADELPELNAHCVDGGRTRVTVTSAIDSSGRRIWQIGGDLAEIGVELDERQQIHRAAAELASVLPDLDLSSAQWATYRADRAEHHSPRTRRPSDISILTDGPVLTCWPTKLALAPRLAEQITRHCGKPQHPHSSDELPSWPTPPTAHPPWEEARRWVQTDPKVHHTPTKTELE